MRRGIDPEEWERRLKYRYPMLRHFTNRSFGVEIEVFGLKYSVSTGDQEVIPPYKITNRSPEGVLLPKVFESQGISLNGLFPDAPPYTAWSFVLDDSIKGAGGSELVSPILSGLKGLAQVYEVLLLLQEFPEILVNETCGFHVHHGVDPFKFGPRELRQLVQTVSMFEDHIYHLLPLDRRGAETCRPLEVDLYEWFNPGEPDPDEDRLRDLWYSPENRDDPLKPRHRRLHPTRYHGLNLHSYWYRGTIEFRYFPSLLDQPEELMQWIIFTQFLVEWSEGRRPVLEYIPQPNKWLNILYKLYLVTGRLDHVQFPQRPSAPEEG
jgi:hypothetical protein